MRQRWVRHPLAVIEYAPSFHNLLVYNYVHIGCKYDLTWQQKTPTTPQGCILWKFTKYLNCQIINWSNNELIIPTELDFSCLTIWKHLQHCMYKKVVYYKNKVYFLMIHKICSAVPYKWVPNNNEWRMAAMN